MDKFKAVTPIVIYGFILGLAYSFSFWGRFSVNPMEFASLIDVAKVAAWPVGGAAFVLSANILISPFLYDDWSTIEHIPFPLKISPEWLSRVIRATWAGLLSGYVFWLLGFSTSPVRWLGVGVCLAALSVGRLHEQRVIRE